MPLFLAMLRRSCVILLVGIALLINLTDLYNIANRWHPDAWTRNQVSSWEARMQAVRKSLPSDTKAVGYISAQDLPNGSYTIEQTTAFSLTRFALAPVTVHRGIKEAWIVGYFRSPNFEGWLKEKLGGASQITDLGFGIYLIHRVQ